eukprot:14533944-Ditylum_brightwellii.AAC.1
MAGCEKVWNVLKSRQSQLSRLCDECRPTIMSAGERAVVMGQITPHFHVESWFPLITNVAYCK